MRTSTTSRIPTRPFPSTFRAAARIGAITLTLLMLIMGAGCTEGATGPAGSNPVDPAVSSPRLTLSGSYSGGTLRCEWVGSLYYCWATVDGSNPEDPNAEPTDPYGPDCQRSCDPLATGDFGGGSTSATAPDGFPQSGYDELNSLERELLWKNPPQSTAEGFKAYRAALSARAWAAKQPVTGEHNGPQDALRHAMWNCLMTQSIGESPAKNWADAHEWGATNQPADEAAMDFHNNEVGRKIGLSGGSCSEGVVNAYNNGELIILGG